MKHFRPLSVAATLIFFVMLICGLFTGTVNAQTTTDGNGEDISSGGSDLFLLGLLFVLVVVVFVLALVSGNVGLLALSGGLWVALGFALQVFGVGGGFAAGFSYICFLLGFVMIAFMFAGMYRMLTTNGKSKDVVESVF